MEIIEHTFLPRDLVAGHLVLDFINTVTARDQPLPKDWLASFSGLLQWAGLTQRFSAQDLSRAAKIAEDEPELAASALEDIKGTREAIYHAVSALVSGSPLPDPDLANLHRRWLVASTRARLGIEGGALRLEPVCELAGLEQLADALVLDAGEFLKHPGLSRIRCCAGSHCGWHFVDTSKGGRRRWCDMTTCGNVAKANRHRRKLALAHGDRA